MTDPELNANQEDKREKFPPPVTSSARGSTNSSTTHTTTVRSVGVDCGDVKPMGDSPAAK